LIDNTIDSFSYKLYAYLNFLFHTLSKEDTVYKLSQLCMSQQGIKFMTSGKVDRPRLRLLYERHATRTTVLSGLVQRTEGG